MKKQHGSSEGKNRLGNFLKSQIILILFTSIVISCTSNRHCDTYQGVTHHYKKNNANHLLYTVD